MIEVSVYPLQLLLITMRMRMLVCSVPISHALSYQAMSVRIGATLFASTVTVTILIRCFIEPTCKQILD